MGAFNVYLHQARQEETLDRLGEKKRGAQQQPCILHYIEKDGVRRCIARRSNIDHSFLVEVDPCLLCDGIESMLLDGLEGLGGEAELDVALAGLPPQLLVLQIDELLLLGLVVGEGHLVGPIRPLVQERADPAWNQRPSSSSGILFFLGKENA